MVILIRNMMCERCILAVQAALEALQLPCKTVAIGSADTGRELSIAELSAFRDALEAIGLGLLQDASEALTEKIRHRIVRHVYEEESGPARNFSVLLSEELNRNYTYLTNLFSRQTGSTIGQCLISHRIARAKDMLRQQGLSLTAIAGQLHYSSVAHLSAQFHKITGETPTAFRRNLLMCA